MTDHKCPACGAAVSFLTSIALFAVCPFCRSLVMRKDLNLEDLGKLAQLQPDGSPLQVGTRGFYRGAAFQIVGRVQFRMPIGFWNEWATVFDDGRQGWIGEAQGTYAVSFLSKSPAPSAERLVVDGKAAIGDQAYVVRERVTARFESAEGELPYKPPLGVEADTVDLVAPGGRFATIDFSENPPLVFEGEYQEFDLLAFSNLRKVEGWG